MADWYQAIIPVAAIAGWILITMYRMYLVGKRRELAHRERMAMIERGLQPPAEPALEPLDRRDHGSPASRNRRTAIILIAVGIGLAAMLAVSGAGPRGLGASAFLVILGVAFLLIGAFDRGSDPGGGPGGPPPR